MGAEARRQDGVSSPTDRAATIGALLDAAAIAGTVGVVVIGFGRALSLLLAGRTGLEADTWVVFGFVALVVGAFGLALQHSRPDSPRRMRFAELAAILAIAAALLLEAALVASVGEGRIGVLRAGTTVMVLALVHVIAYVVDVAPVTRLVSWFAIGASAVVAAVGVASGALDPLELGTLALAVALIATGAIHLTQNVEARSWPWLGPGVAVLLVPSLLATITDRPVWRLVALGVVGIAIMIVGALGRLQAPFLIASVVVLVHVIATFLPQIRAAYGFFPWWLWLAVCGVVLIALAARYERRIRDLRAIGERFAALR